MDLGLGLGTGIDATIDTDEQKTIQPASDSSSSTSLSEMGRIRGSKREFVLGNADMVKYIASFLFGDITSKTDNERCINFFENSPMLRVCKDWWNDLHPLINQNMVRLHRLLLEDPDFFNQIMNSKAYKALKAAIQECKNFNISLTALRDPFGNNLLHNAAMLNDTKMFRLLRNAAPELYHQQNNAGKYPINLASTSTKLRVSSKWTKIILLLPALLQFFVSMTELLFNRPSASISYTNLPNLINNITEVGEGMIILTILPHMIVGGFGSVFTHFEGDDFKIYALACPLGICIVSVAIILGLWGALSLESIL
jgi:hypothetical protein